MLTGKLEDGYASSPYQDLDTLNGSLLTNPWKPRGEMQSMSSTGNFIVVAQGQRKPGVRKRCSMEVASALTWVVDLPYGVRAKLIGAESGVHGAPHACNEERGCS